MDGEVELEDRNLSTEGEGTTEVENQYPDGIRLVATIVALILSIFLSALDGTILATAIPSITVQFHSLDDVGWYSSAYAISNASFQSTWGKAYRYFPLKQVYLSAVAIFELGNLICATATSSRAVIAGRIIAGLGGGGIMSGVFIIIAFTAKPKYKAAYFGVLGVTFGVSSVVGPLMGGTLADGPGWRYCFWISLPLGCIAAGMMIVSFTTPATAAPASATLKQKLVNMDLIGSLSIMACAICFVLAMHWGGSLLPWNSPQVVGSLASFIALAALFLANEWRMGSNAMIRGQLLKKRAIQANLFYMFFISGLYSSLQYSLPIQFQAINSNSASQSGIRLIPLVLGISVFTMVANVILTFRRTYLPFLIVGGLLSTIGCSMIYTLDSAASVGVWVAYELLAAIGIGLTLQLPMLANQAEVTAEDIPAVTTLTLFVETIGQALIVAASEAAFTNQLMKSLALYAPDLDPLAVVHAGASQIHGSFSSADVPGILMAYLEGCKVDHLVSVSCGVAACAVSFVMAVPAGKTQWKKWLHKPHRP